MRLFFDLRLGYLVDAPGQSSPLNSLSGKAGDGQPVEIQFGRSSDPVGGGSFFEGPTWEPEQLPGGSIIKVGIKLAGEFSDGDFLASTATFSYDSERESYTGSLNLNTEEIDAALNRGDEDPANDEPSVSCGFELTYQPGGSGPWRSSQEPVSYLLRHDIIFGDEATPVSSAEPDEYLLKAQGIVWLPDVTGLVGGTGSDLDSIPTTTLDLGYSVAMVDEGASPPALRFYRLEESDDATSAPEIIRPDDFEATTNERVWRAYHAGLGMTNPMTAAGDLIVGGSGGAQQRLAAGTANQQLRVNSTGDGLEYFSPAASSPVPSGTALYMESGTISGGDLGKLITVAASSQNVELSLPASPADGAHFWAVCTDDDSGTYFAIILKGSGNLYWQSDNANIDMHASNLGKVFFLWHRSGGTWWVLSTS